VFVVDSIFRQYDIRGKVGSELVLDQVYDLGCAMAAYFIQKNPLITSVAVGMDGRTHSSAIQENLCKAFLDSGLNVTFIGVCPTPVLYFSLFNLQVGAGVMITASHNTKEYNGFKICFNKESVWGSQIQEIKKLFAQRAAIVSPKKGILEYKDLIRDYISWIKEHFSHLIGMKSSVIVDCANGAAGSVLPQLLEAMEWSNVTLLFAEIDGTYPNHEADPIVEKNMVALKNLLAETDSAYGIGLDGDCDRMAPMTHDGELIVGDKLLAVFAEAVLKKNPNSTIVYDTKCSSGLTERLISLGAHPCMSPSGHSIIKDQMKKTGAILAGELSCHFFFKDRYFGYDDGIYAMLRLFEILQTTEKTLPELLTSFPKKFITPELRFACKEADMDAIVQQVYAAYSAKPDVTFMTLDGIRVVMPDGWGMVRASNTQPVVCLRFESDTVVGLARIKHEFAELLKPYIADDLLQELH